MKKTLLALFVLLLAASLSACNFWQALGYPASTPSPTAIQAPTETAAPSTGTPTQAPTETPPPTPSPTTTAETSIVQADEHLPLVGEVFQSPVECQEAFNQESSWLICEPGVLLDATAAWVIPSVQADHFANIPEGGFTYFSMGEGVISIDGIDLYLPGEEGLNYLVLVRGRIDDGIVDSDLNETSRVTAFVPGHAIWSIMPPGAYVSKGWFRQQLVVSTTTGGTNCGATGCSQVRIVLFDVDSHFYQVFEVHAGDLDNWTLMETNSP